MFSARTKGRTRQPGRTSGKRVASRNRKASPGVQIERLEERTLMNNDLYVITHGYQLDGRFPTWVYDMAQVIDDRLPVVERCSSEQIQASRVQVFGPPPSGQGCAAFLLLDWADQSNEAQKYSGNLRTESQSWAEAAGIILAGHVATRLLNAGSPLNLHFIGHSRGAVVNSEAIERLNTDVASSRIRYLQMTTLDAHPVHVGEWTPLGRFEVADPAPVVSSNTHFADNYFQRTDYPDGMSFIASADARSPSRAINVNLTRPLDSWPNGVVENNHSQIHEWYHGTIWFDPTRTPAFLYSEISVPSAGGAVSVSGAYNMGFRWSEPYWDTVAAHFENAANLSVGQDGSAWRSEKVFPRRDRDMFQFTAPRSGRASVSVSADPSDPVSTAVFGTLDASLTAYDVNRQLLAWSDDSGGSLNSRVAFDVLQGQTYYVNAAGSGDSTGPFTLSVSIAPPPAEPPPVVSVPNVALRVTNVNTQHLNVRTGPGTTHTILTSVSEGQEFVAYRSSDGWYQIHLPSSAGRLSGWISGSFTTQDPTATQVEVRDTGDVGLRVRSDASTSSTILSKVWDGQRFVAIGQAKSGPGCAHPWYPISLPTSVGAPEGWICGDYLTVHTSTQPPFDLPTIGVFTVSPNPVVQPNAVTLQATSVSGSPRRVEFYWDGNGDGVGQQQELLGTDGDGTDGWSWTVSSTGLPLGPVPLLARAIDSGGSAGGWNYTVLIVRDASQAPVIGELTVIPNPVIRPDPVTVVARSVRGPVSRVEFYRDMNGNAIGEPQELLGTDSRSSDGWDFAVSTAGWPEGPIRLLARAIDDSGNTSNWASTMLATGSRPTIGRLTANPNPVVRWFFTTVRASSVTGPVSFVQFYRDINHNGVADINPDGSSPERLGTDSSGADGWTWVGFPTDEWPAGPVTILARAFDSDFSGGDWQSLVLTVRESAVFPTIGSLTATPNPLMQPNVATLSADTVSDNTTRVDFFLDANNNGRGETGELLGSDSTGAEGWTWSGSTEGWPIGSLTLLARAAETVGEGDHVYDFFSDWQSTVLVSEVPNRPPVLEAIGDKFLSPGRLLSFAARASDLDTPPDPLTFSLDGESPAGASIDPNSGIFTWTPTAEQAPGTYELIVRVTDGGQPSLSDAQTFKVTLTRQPGMCEIEPSAGSLFAPARDIPIPDREEFRTKKITTGDFNGDGKLDMAVGSRPGDGAGSVPGVTVLLGDGRGGFGNPIDFFGVGAVNAIASGDFNRDGLSDVVIPGAVLLSDGNGSFSSVVGFQTDIAPRALTVGDFNHDGYLDVAVANGHSQSPGVSVALADGRGGFSDRIQLGAFGVPYGIATADFNHDGHLDLAVADGANSTTLSVLLGTGNGFFGGPNAVLVPYQAENLATGDFNGDGRSDIVLGTAWSGSGVVLLGNGSGGFSASTRYPSGLWGSSVATGDFDSDGKLDWAVVSSDSGAASVFLGDGLGGFRASAGFPVGHLASDIASGDFNGDGLLDLAVPHYVRTINELGGVSLLLNTARPRYTIQMSPVQLDPASDTGRTGDGRTRRVQPTFRGSVTRSLGSSAGILVELDVDGNGYDDGTARSDDAGRYVIASLRSIVPDTGNQLVSVRATDLWQNQCGVFITVAVDSTPPVVTLTLHPASDSATPGDNRTSLTQPILVGVVSDAAPFENDVDSLLVDLDVDGDGYDDGQALTAADGSYLVTVKQPLAIGVHEVSARATDLAGNVGIGSLTVTIGEEPHDNEPPVAHDQGVLLVEDTPAPVHLIGTDPEGSDITYRISNPPTHGTLSGFDPATGSVTYMPEPNWHGLDTFTFVASDGTQDSEPATVYVRVDPVNDEPVATGTTPDDTPLVGDEHETITIDLCDYARDVETPCEELLFEIVDEWGSTVETGDDGHTITLTPDDSDEEFGGFTYSVTDTGDGCDPDIADCEGTEQFSEPLSAEATISILVDRNDPPCIEDVDAEVDEDGSVLVQLDDCDPDGDPLEFGLLDERSQFGSIELVDLQLGIVRYTPDPDWNSLLDGPDCFVYTASDGREVAEATVCVTVREINDAPIANDDDIETDEDTSADVDLWDLVLDLETPLEELSFQIVAAENGGAELIDGHIVRFTPDANYNGQASFRYTVTDTGEGDSPALRSGPATVTIDVLPVNDEPVAYPSSVTVEEDGSIVIQLVASDVDGDPLTFELVADPENGCIVEFDETTGLVRFQPHAGFTGIDSLSFVANDGESESNLATVTIDVRPLEPGFRFEDGVLRVVGTEGNDFIRVVSQRTRSSQSLKTPAGSVVVPPGSGYVVVMNQETFTIAKRSDLKRMLVRGRGGNDTINVAALTASQTADLYGEGGNDRITGGRGPDIVVGGDGNDTTNGGGGDDLVIGGAGRDRIVGGIGNDLLVSGSLIESDDPCERLDLRGLLDEWRSASAADERGELAASLVDLVLDDGELDLLTGGIGSDGFLPGVLDRIIDRQPDDVVVAV